MIGYGDTFMFADDDDPKGHLHIIISQPTASGEVVTVSVTSEREHSDSTVRLNKGDHPRITHPSVAAFTFARIRTIAQIEALIKNHDAQRKSPVDERVLDRCRKGAVDSDNTPNDVRWFLELLNKSDEP